MQSFRSILGKSIPRVFLSCIAALAGISVTAAQSDGPADRGRAVVEKWCRVCHVRTLAEQSPEMAPPFQKIVKRPGRDAAYLRAFLDEDHFPMTTFRLFDYEKDEVVAYLMWLKVK